MISCVLLHCVMLRLLTCADPFSLHCEGELAEEEVQSLQANLSRPVDYQQSQVCLHRVSATCTHSRIANEINVWAIMEYSQDVLNLSQWCLCPVQDAVLGRVEQAACLRSRDSTVASSVTDLRGAHVRQRLVDHWDPAETEPRKGTHISLCSCGVVNLIPAIVVH